jgi:GNAT superfamily N-acetyltransferase
MDGVRITPPTSADIDTLAEVWIASWEETYRGLMPDHIIATRTLEGRRTIWRELLASGGADRSRVAWSDAGHAVGFVIVSPARTVGAFADGELAALYLLRAWQRRGIGRQLLLTACDLARQLGYRALGFWVLQGNSRAEHVYAASGARQIVEKSPDGYIETGWRLDL